MFYVLLTALLVVLIAATVFYKKHYHSVEEGTVLIINGMNAVSAHFDGGFVWPVIEKKMVMKTTLMSLQLDRHHVSFIDGIDAHMTVVFYIRVGQTDEDVLNVAKTVGVVRASSIEAINELFYEKFSEALAVVAKQFRFVSVSENNARFTKKVLQEVGSDLCGYVVEELKVIDLQQTSSLLNG